MKKDVLAVAALCLALVSTAQSCDTSTPVPVQPTSAPVSTPSQPVALASATTPASTALVPEGTPTIISSSQVSATISPDITSWIREHAIPFRTDQPGADDSDLMPLKQIVGEARIVALGEATHGTHEFFNMKNRILQFLVKETGFNVFAMEFPSWPEGDMVNDYVHTGKGDATLLLRGVEFGPWKSQEVLDLIQWMRSHNGNPGASPTVSFYGVDMQNYPPAIDDVTSYLEKVDPDNAGEITSSYRCFSTISMDQYESTSNETKEQCRAGVQKVYTVLTEKRTTYEAASSTQEFAHALRSARVVVQSEAFWAVASSPAAGDLRDQYMAENVEWILDQAGPNAKMVLWAHNGHVMNYDADVLGYKQPGGGQQKKTMGAHLRARYGNQLRIFGFDFSSGSFNAASPFTNGGMIPQELVPPPVDSYEHGFAATGLPRMILDLRNVRRGSVAGDWLFGPHPMLSIGYLYDRTRPEVFMPLLGLPDMFDAVIYFEASTPSNMLAP